MVWDQAQQLRGPILSLRTMLIHGGSVVDKREGSHKPPCRTSELTDGVHIRGQPYEC